MLKIAQNGIWPAAEQLQGHGQGGVVVYSDFTPAKELVDVVLRGLYRANPALLSSVGFAIPGSLGARAVIWRNPAVPRSPACEALADSRICSRRMCSSSDAMIASLGQPAVCFRPWTSA